MSAKSPSAPTTIETNLLIERGMPGYSWRSAFRSRACSTVPSDE